MNTLSKADWIEAIKRVAQDRYEFTAATVAATPWDSYWELYGADCSPQEAMAEELSRW